ncbi:MAG TPA: hypothetical protein VHW04_07750 [Solirubrobacteraceae bacterium]|nr:hypothetical protein [Solirubrobacteraceae bacterium]
MRSASRLRTFVAMSNGNSEAPQSSAPGLWALAFAVLYDPVLWVRERLGMCSHRRDLLQHASGQTVELGSGTGVNLAHYPDDLDKLILTEPEAPMRTRLERKLGRSGRSARVLGAAALVEHVRSESARLASWQDRLAWPGQRFAEGCRCNRATIELIKACELEVDQVRTASWRGMPPIVRPLVAGRARPKSPAQ